MSCEGRRDVVTRAGRWGDTASCHPGSSCPNSQERAVSFPSHRNTRAWRAPQATGRSLSPAQRTPALGSLGRRGQRHLSRKSHPRSTWSQRRPFQLVSFMHKQNQGPAALCQPGGLHSSQVPRSTLASLRVGSASAGCPEDRAMAPSPAEKTALRGQLEGDSLRRYEDGHHKGQRTPQHQVARLSPGTTASLPSPGAGQVHV